jgi:hypothetical protein
VSGKVTYLHGRHASAAGGWVGKIEIGDAAWRAMESAIERPLSAAERERIADVISLHRHFLTTAREMRVTAQDQKKTLAVQASNRLIGIHVVDTLDSCAAVLSFVSEFLCRKPASELSDEVEEGFTYVVDYVLDAIEKQSKELEARHG